MGARLEQDDAIRGHVVEHDAGGLVVDQLLEKLEQGSGRLRLIRPVLQRQTDGF